jgi:putative transposase
MRQLKSFSFLGLRSKSMMVILVSVKLSYKYRLYPNRAQTEVIQQNLRFCCFLYNCALQERNDHYKRFGKGVSYAGQCQALPEIKREFAEQTQSIYSQSLQQVLKRLDVSYQNFFRRVKSKADKVGFPRYKSSDRFSSMVFPQSDLKGGGVKLLENNKLAIFGLPGEVKVKWHRPFQGRCKQVMIIKRANKFYLVLSCENVPSEHLAKTGKTIGIDLGLTSFITADDGTKFHHPKPYKTAKEKLAWLNRKLADKQRGSQNRRRAKQSLARAYEQVSNIRKDFLHKVAKQLVVENDVVVVEKLNITSMLEAKGFEINKGNIQDASWGNFVTLLSYKAERAGKIIMEVDPRNTSKRCSGCGKVKQELTLQDREYQCQSCGLTLDRDQNAAINIRRLGMSLAADTTASEASVL